jgi:hypothetical protein
VPYPNDRRKHRADAEEVPSSDYLAMLAARGGEVYPGRREPYRKQENPQYGRRKDDAPRPDPTRRSED